MPNADGMILASGGIALAGNYREANGFPENGVVIVAATIALVVIASTTRGTMLERPVKALAGLMLLAVVFRYVPGFTKKVGKKNG